LPLLRLQSCSAPPEKGMQAGFGESAVFSVSLIKASGTWQDLTSEGLIFLVPDRLGSPADGMLRKWTFRVERKQGIHVVLSCEAPAFCTQREAAQQTTIRNGSRKVAS